MSGYCQENCNNPDIYYDQSTSTVYSTVNMFDFAPHVPGLEVSKMAGNQATYYTDSNPPNGFWGGGVAFFGTGSTTAATNESNYREYQVNPWRAPAFGCDEGMEKMYASQGDGTDISPPPCFAGADTYAPDSDQVKIWTYALNTFPCIRLIQGNVSYTFHSMYYNASTYWYYCQYTMFEEGIGPAFETGCAQVANVEWINPGYDNCTAVWNPMAIDDDTDYKWNGYPCQTEYSFLGPINYAQESQVGVPPKLQAACLKAQTSYLSTPLSATGGFVCPLQTKAVPPGSGGPTLSYIPAVEGYSNAGLPAVVATIDNYCNCNCIIDTEGNTDFCSNECTNVAANGLPTVPDVQAHGWYINKQSLTCVQAGAGGTGATGIGTYPSQTVCQAILAQYDTGDVLSGNRLILVGSLVVGAFVVTYGFYIVMSIKGVTGTGAYVSLFLIFLVLLAGIGLFAYYY